MGFEIEPKRKSVDEVAGEEFSKSAIPKPSDQVGVPSNTTATESPGTLFADMKLATAFSIASRFSFEIVFCCAASCEAEKKIRKER